MKSPIMSTLTAACAFALLFGCGIETGDAPFAPRFSPTQQRSAAHWSPWSEPVNLGPIVNSTDRDINAALSPDGLSLYFVSNRPGGLGNNDLWVSRRASRDDEWGAPVNLGAGINSAFDDGGASLSDDGLMLFFNSNRPGGYGLADIYVSRRTDHNDDLSWGPPVNLGPNLNTAAGERGPEYSSHGDRGAATLYFNRGELGPQQVDLYAVRITRDGTPLGPAEVLANVNAPAANDAGQTVSSNGKEILFWSNRTPGLGSADIWSSTRQSVNHPWSAAENIGRPVNTEFAEERPELSRDGRTLLFDSDRPGPNGGQDLWMSTRARIEDEDEDDGDADRYAEPLQFSAWSAPVNLGPVVNSTTTDIEVSVSKDGRSLYLASSRPGGFGGFDIWVSKRESVDDPWGPPQNLGPTVNTEANEQAPFLTVDGHHLYFFSNRAGGFGGNDLYVARRQDKRDDLGWQAPENLGSAVNSSSNENLSAQFENTLYFNSNRPGGVGGTDIYASTVLADGSFSPAVLVPELSSPLQDAGMAIRRDGLEMILASNRAGSIPPDPPSGVGFDLWVATRANTTSPWSTPAHLGPEVNTASGESRMSLSFDGTTLYIISDRPGGVGNLDVWMSTRQRLAGDKGNNEVVGEHRR